ncbi:MAG: histidine phosphatase family protein, partial [Erysipelotrichaceae bacterium]|nr:histidine phosphatase family protein [Erysipelotrichaceae bacterium]
MTKIYFVRHAEPDYSNHDDRTRELSRKGLIDREFVTEFLSDKQIDIVISSPFKRTVDTIKPFCEKYGFDIEIIEDFRERKVGTYWIKDFSD